MKNAKQGKTNKNAPLSKKQRKRLEKRGVVIKDKRAPKADGVKMPKEQKFFIALVAVIALLAIVCATFGGILIASAVGNVPYGSIYDTLKMSNYLDTRRMGKPFYTNNTFDFTEIEKYYAPKDAAYMDEYIEGIRLEHREEVALGQKLTPVGFADDVALYITDIFRGESPADEAAEKANRIPTSTMPLGTYIQSITFTVGTEYFGKDFDDKLIALNLKPADTGREVRYNGTIALDDTVCLSYVVYKSKSAKTEGVTEETPLLDRYTWNTKAESAGKNQTRVDLSEDIDATLAAALVENCKAMGETYTFVLENYSLSGDGSNKATYKIEAQIHFAVETEVTRDVTFTFPEDYFTEGDGATLKALNGKTVTFRVIVAASDDYELPVFDRKFITETLEVELTATDEAGALAEYKEKELARINESLAENKEMAKLRTAYLHLANKANTSSLFVNTEFPTSLVNAVKSSLLSELRTNFISTYGFTPTTDQLNSYAAAQYAQMGGQQQITTYSEYLMYVADSQITQELLMYYVFRDAGLKITDEMLEAAYRAQIDEFIENAGDPETYDEEYFVNYYTKDVLYAQVRRDLVYHMVGDYLLAKNTQKLS